MTSKSGNNKKSLNPNQSWRKSEESGSGVKK